jgi:hypothetical protein
LQRQEAGLRDALVAKVQTTNLIVSGYSGRDESVMEALRAAYDRPGSGELYWCGRTDPDPPRSSATSWE